MERVMRRRMTTLVLLLLLLTLKVSTSSIKGEDGNYGSKRVVRVENDLGPNVTLKLYCRSGDDDLGTHDLQNQQYYEWSFKMSFIKQTRYWCNIQWNNNNNAANFDAFSTKRDSLRCSDQCFWSIKPDGGYSYNQYSRVYEKLYTWS